MIKHLTNSFSHQISNIAFRAIKDTETRTNLSTYPLENKEKVEALAKVILSLSNSQLQYLNELQNAHVLQKGQKISDTHVFSIGQEKVSFAEYLYQKRWIQDSWKEYPIFTSLYSDEADGDGNQEAAEIVKEIWEFELTSVEASQKIKVIKVIRELLGLGLKEAKDIVDKAPTVMKKGKKEEGEALAAELAKNGCVVTLK